MPIDWLVLGGALLSGLLGGAHCAAMCGGIATSLSVQQRGGWWMALQPNLGRVPAIRLRAPLWVASATACWIWRACPHSGLPCGPRWGGTDHRGTAPVGSPRPPAFPGASGGRMWQWLRPLQRRFLPADTAGKRMAAGPALGLDALWSEHHPVGRGLAAGQRAAWWDDHGRIRSGHAAGDAAADMGRRAFRSASAARRLAHRNGSMRVARGLLTLAAPWLMHAPAMHCVLALLGAAACRRSEIVRRDRGGVVPRAPRRARVA